MRASSRCPPLPLPLPGVSHRRPSSHQTSPPGGSPLAWHAVLHGAQGRRAADRGREVVSGALERLVVTNRPGVEDREMKREVEREVGRRNECNCSVEANRRQNQSPR